MWQSPVCGNKAMLYRQGAGHLTQYGMEVSAWLWAAIP